MPLRAAEWSDSTFELDRSPQPDWLLTQMDDFASRAPFGDDKRVQLGFFFDSYFLPQNVISDTLNHVKKAGIKLVTSHYRHWPISKGMWSRCVMPERPKRMIFTCYRQANHKYPSN